MSSELHDAEAVLKELGRTSKASFTLLVLGALALIGSLIYSAVILEPLEKDIQQKQKFINQQDKQIAGKTQQINRLTSTAEDLNSKITAAKFEYDELRKNIEKLYATRVTSDNQVYELKATAKATKHKTESGYPVYDFRIFINAPTNTLESIRSVTYLFDHDTFRQKNKTSENPKENFMTQYFGWGCLTRVTARLQLRDGTGPEINFNMCQSLGPLWTVDGSDNGPPKKIAPRDSDLIKKLIMQAPEPIRKISPQ